jgi:hypothetical protein
MTCGAGFAVTAVREDSSTRPRLSLYIIEVKNASSWVGNNTFMETVREN